MWAIVGYVVLGTFGTVFVFSLGLAALWAFKSGMVSSVGSNVSARMDTGSAR